MIPQETRPCELGIKREILSALRDDALSSEDVTRLNQHIQSCAACRATLADFDFVASAVRNQRELHPGNRVWNGVRMRVSHRVRPQFSIPIPSRVFRGLGGVAAAAAVVLLFVYVLKTGPGMQGKSTARATPTATVTPAPPLMPTSTPPSTSASDTSSFNYYFHNTVVAKLTTQLDATHVFDPQNITPDGQFLLGYELDSSTKSNPAIARAGYLNVKTHQFTALGLPDGTEMAPPGCCQADGRYLLATDNSQPGATCGICHTRVWIYDTLTSQLYQLVEGGQYQGITTVYLSQGHVVFDSGMGIEIADVVSRSIHPLDTALSPDARALAFTWPFVIYSSPSSSGALSYYAQDLASGSTPRVIPQLPASTAGQVNLNLSGTTLYMTTQQSGTARLYSLPSFMSSSSKLVELGSSQHTQSAYTLGYLSPHWANGKAVIVGTAIWVDATHKFYPLVPYDQNLSGAALSGNYLATFVTLPSHTNTYAGSYVTVYNTALVP